MSSRRTRRIGPLLALAAGGASAAISGCSPTTTAATSTTAAPRTAVATDPTAPPATPAPGEDQGAFMFRTQCAGCHGPTGEGNLGPALVGIADRMTEADQLTLVHNGRGRMPAFSPALTDAEIAAVVAYTRTALR